MHEAAFGAVKRARDPDALSFTHTLLVTRRTLPHVAAIPLSGRAAAAGAVRQPRRAARTARELKSRPRRAPRRQTEDE